MSALAVNAAGIAILMTLAGLVSWQPRLGRWLALAAGLAVVVFLAWSLVTGTLFAPSGRDAETSDSCGYSRVC